MAVAPADLERFATICERERCPFAVVGEATSEKHLTLNDRHFDSRPVDLPMSVLFGKAPKMHREVTTVTPALTPISTDGIEFDEAVERVLRHPTVANKSFLINIGDRTVTGMVVRDQMVGPWQVPVADCAVTTVTYDSYVGEAMAMGERTPLALIDAPASGRLAVGEAITNIAATRIGDISDIKLSANWMCAAGHPGEDARLYRTVEAVGMELCPALGLTVPVGKDSMSMRTAWQEDGQEKSVTAPLSLIVSAFSPVLDVRKTVTPQLRPGQPNALLLIDLGAGADRLGGSVLAQVYEQLGDRAPDLDHPENLRSFFTVMQQLLEEELLLAYHDRSDGGLLTTLVEMAFAGHCGIKTELPAESEWLSSAFNEELGAVLQVRQNDLQTVQNRFAAAGLGELVHSIGQAYPGDEIAIDHCGENRYRASRSQLQRIWSETSYRIQALRDNADCAAQEFARIDAKTPGLSAELTFDAQEDIAAPYIARGIRPRVAVLREQGVNGHVEMAAAFDRAGFSAVDVHMSDILDQRIDLDDFKGLVACGGFSYGDVLGAGEGWAKTILFNSLARDAFSGFFERRDTFTLGVCNGCQMISNLRDLIPGAAHWPRFVRNLSEQFEARMTLVRVEQSPSVLLANMAGSHLPIVVAHGEGRAEFSSDRALEDCDKSGLVALRYLENDLSVAGTYPANPNGSPAGITALTSADGRATVMMPHPERLFRTVTHSWHPEEWGEDGPWLRLFRNARVFVD